MFEPVKFFENDKRNEIFDDLSLLADYNTFLLPAKFSDTYKVIRKSAARLFGLFISFFSMISILVIIEWTINFFFRIENIKTFQNFCIQGDSFFSTKIPPKAQTFMDTSTYYDKLYARKRHNPHISYTILYNDKCRCIAFDRSRVGQMYKLKLSKLWWRFSIYWWRFDLIWWRWKWSFFFWKSDKW